MKLLRQCASGTLAGEAAHANAIETARRKIQRHGHSGRIASCELPAQMFRIFLRPERADLHGEESRLGIGPGDHVQPDGSRSGADHADGSRSGKRKIDHSIGYERTAVVDAHLGLHAVGKISNSDN